MPGSLRRGAGTILAVLTSLQAATFLLASGTVAAPAPTPTPEPSASDSPCDLLIGPAKEYCVDDSGRAGTNSVPPTDALDPLTSLAQGCADAAAWIVGKLSEAVDSTANVDFTNPKFLQQYAVIFAASTILTLVLWLLAVTKRAIRGVPLTTAISEAVGFLWLTVLASAFTPLILYTIVSATDGVTEVIASSTGGQTDVFFGSFAEALKKGTDIGGGPIMLIVVSLVSIVAAGVLWLENRHPSRPALRRRPARHRRLRRPRRQEHVGPRPPLGRHHDRGDHGQAGHRHRPRPRRSALRRRRPRRLLGRRLRPRHHPAGHLRLRHDLPLRPRLRRRDPGRPHQPQAGHRRRPGRRPHQLPRRPRLPGHQDPQRPQRPEQRRWRRRRPPLQPGQRRRRRTQLPHLQRRRRRRRGRRRICPLRRTLAPQRRLRSHIRHPHSSRPFRGSGSGNTGNSSTGGGGR